MELGLARSFKMQIGIIGLGRLGPNTVQRLIKRGHECVIYDLRAAPIKQLAHEGVVAASSFEDLVARERYRV